MRIVLSSYHQPHGIAEGDEEASEVEFSPESEQYMTGREYFIEIRMSKKVAWVKADELKRVADICGQ